MGWGWGRFIKGSPGEFLCGNEIVWILFGGGYIKLYAGSNCIELHPLPSTQRST